MWQILLALVPMAMGGMVRVAGVVVAVVGAAAEVDNG